MLTVKILGLILAFQSIAHSESQSIASALRAIETGDTERALRLLDDVTDVNSQDGALLYAAVMKRQPAVYRNCLRRELTRTCGTICC